MRLNALDPVWLSPDVFKFRCPHCQKTWLLCKRVPMSFKEQVRLVHEHLRTAPEDEHDWPIDFVPMKDSAVWNIQGEFAVMSVTPSIDASASGHWHGFIRQGNCEP